MLEYKDYLKIIGLHYNLESLLLRIIKKTLRIHSILSKSIKNLFKVTMYIFFADVEELISFFYE